MRSDQGFTLLEVLVAVMILALSVTSILTQFSAAMEAGSRSRDITEAILHAKEKLEDLKDLVETEDTGGGAGTFEDGYTWETRVDLYELPEKEGDAGDFIIQFELLQLTAVVRWDVGGRERQVELSTLKAVKKQEHD